MGNNAVWRNERVSDVLRRHSAVVECFVHGKLKVNLLPLILDMVCTVVDQGAAEQALHELLKRVRPLRENLVHYLALVILKRPLPPV